MNIILQKIAFIEDLNREELFVIELESAVIGCIAISTLMHEESISIK